jgi:hypothetical protein
MKIDIVERYNRALVDKVMPKRALSHFDILNKDFSALYIVHGIGSVFQQNTKVVGSDIFEKNLNKVFHLLPPLPL